MRQFLLLMLSISFSCSLHPFYPDYSHLSDIFGYYPKSTFICMFRYDQTCTLARYGVSSFLESVKRRPDLYKHILSDIKEHASFNNTPMPRTFYEIIRVLDKRIARIENIQGKKIDNSTLALGVGQIAVSGAIIYTMHYVYQHFYLKDEKELQRLEDSSLFGNVHEKLCLERNLYVYDHLSLVSLFMAIVAGYSGVLNIYNGFNPHYDDAYLETYKNLLAETYRERYDDTRRRMKPSE